MEYDSAQMKYKGSHANEEPRRGKGKLTREDFKKDVADAVKQGMKKPPKPKKKRAARASKYGKKGSYENMSVAELRKLLNEKKKNLLIKSGFPNGTLPKSKVAMIALCKQFKRKRW